ncbi:MAG TPA: L-seryl-tRNA(Sec) selenium transferase, partial [Halieaceae bacterium]|nr:L-seryl-tRNA(Sec) selenium transferase [Halieaceae bacterium]
TLPSACLEIRPAKTTDSELRRLAEALRALPTPVIGRLHKGGVLLDLRCLEQEADFIAQLSQLSEALL